MINMCVTRQSMRTWTVDSFPSEPKHLSHESILTELENLVMLSRLGFEGGPQLDLAGGQSHSPRHSHGYPRR